MFYIYFTSALHWPLCHTHQSVFSLFTDVVTSPQSHAPQWCLSDGDIAADLFPLPSFKVLSVGVGRDGNIHDEGRLVLDASVFAIGEGADLHAVCVGLPQCPRGEQHSLQILISQGKRQSDVLIHH